MDLQIVINMEEYELKITFSDTIQDLLRKKHYDHSTTLFLKRLLTQLLKLYKRQNELQVIKFYLSEFQKKKNYETSELATINDLFNLFILSIKKDSAMERFFCYSECESESFETVQGFEDDFTRESNHGGVKNGRAKKIGKKHGKKAIEENEKF